MNRSLQVFTVRIDCKVERLVIIYLERQAKFVIKFLRFVYKTHRGVGVAVLSVLYKLSD